MYQWWPRLQRLRQRRRPGRGRLARVPRLYVAFESEQLMLCMHAEVWTNANDALCWRQVNLAEPFCK